MKKTSRYLLLTILLLIVVMLTGCTVDSEKGNQHDDFPAYEPPAIATDIPVPVVTNNNQSIDTYDPYDPYSSYNPYQSSTLINASQIATPTPNANTITFTIPLKSDDGTPTDDPTNKTVTAPTKQPTATPVGVLKLGSEGSSVKQVQQRLKDLGFLTGSVDGVFGLATETAVKGFQQQYKMNVDGVVGPDTYNRLASARATAIPTAVPTGAPTATPIVSQNVYLKKGSTGTRVTQMQERLIDLGYLAGAANANFDSATELAVIAFQKRNCSYSDGIAGPTTLTALYSNSAKAATSVAGVTGVTLKEGSEGKAVSAVQTKLKALGYLTGSVDGSFGAATTSAVKAFQRANNLTVDGMAGGGTLEKLYSGTAIAASGATSAPTGKKTNTPTSNYSNTYLQKGSSGTIVKQLQERLIALGYLAGVPTSQFDSATQLAVIAFQARTGVLADGVAGPDTLNALFSSSARSTSTAVGVTGITLIDGSNGKAVTCVQSALKSLGYYTGSLDGIWGTATETAVRMFQKNNNLTIDGLAGGETLDKLFSGNAKAASGTTPIKTKAPSAATATPNYNDVYLQKGSTGSQVKTLQERLISLGYLYGIGTSNYDSATAAAVLSFQSRNGLKADGIAGPDTLTLLYSSSARSTSSIAGIVGATLEVGNVGRGVSAVQSLLKSLGYYDGQLDGTFGASTEEAVRAFQKNNNLAVDGRVGGGTLEKLYSGTAKKANGTTATPIKTSAPTATPAFSDQTYLKKGQNNARIKQLQERLIALGYLSGTATSSFDSATEKAVIAFQKRNGVNSDGIAGPDTLTILYSNSAKRATSVAGVIGISLKLDSTGDAVSSIQTELKALGYYTGTVDGKFGETTALAIRAFQKNNSLTVDGNAGSTTLEKLYSGTAKKANGSTPTPTASAAPKATATPAFSDKTYLQKGQNNNRVKQMQERLISLGYVVGTANGNFDSATEAAVIAFQKRAGILSDGIAGPDTLMALYSDSAKKAIAVSGVIGVTLKQNDTGDAVTEVQKQLKALGYYTGNVNGSFGASTAEAVKAFQKNNNMTANGTVTSAMLEKIYAGTAKKANGSTPTPTASSTPKATATPAFSDQTYLKKGQSTNRVKQMQERLLSLGYLVGTANGNFDSATEAAVIAFQKRTGILTDGIAGPDTLMALYSNSAKKATAVSGVIGVTLKQNDTGDAVTEVQKQLKALGYYTGNVNGSFGASTAEAVKAFQKNNNMNANGTVTSAMLEKIYAGTAKKANGSTPTPTASASPKATATPAFSDQTYLKKGQNTNRIKQMQERLVYLGYLTGTANGNFDSATEAAVIAFQKRTGLIADGIAGPDTLTALYSESPKKATAIAGIIGVTLKQNSTGTEVTELQKQLKALGYYSGSLDGIFGDSTLAAVKAFQKNNGMAENGTVNAAMLEMIYSGTAKKANGTTPTPKATVAPAATATPYFSDKTYIKKGESSNRVSVLQERLISLGYLAGKPDNDFDSATEAAVIAFQNKNSLFADGIAGPDTLAILYSSSAKKASSVAGVIGVTLKENDTSEELKLVQQSLKGLGYYTGTVDGVFGATTKSAVIAFQRNNGLKADGSIGSSTLDMIYSGKAKAASGATATPVKTSTPKITATPKATATHKPTATPSYDANTYLQLGSSGKNVKQMQERLISLGYLAGSATSKFDKATEAAVVAFQKKNCSYYDGIAGILTLNALYSNSPKKATSISGVIGVTLTENDEGSAVSGVQIRLKELGYYKGVADGKFGATTTMAVVAFQAANGIKADGTVSTSTLEKLYSDFVVDYAHANATPTPLTTTNPEAYVTVTTAPGNSYATLTRGMRGIPVKTMQQALYAQGYYKGAVDGLFGADTEEAVKAFQRSHNLTVNGIAATATLRALLEGSYPDRS